MAETQVSEPSRRRHVREPPAVPFLWELKPGIPKKDWKPPGVSSVAQVVPPPVKLIASVPFNWEEKPGIPLPCFSLPPEENAPLSPPPKLMDFPSPVVHSQAYNHDAGGKDSGSYEQQGMFDFDLESYSFETEDCFGSPPSLLANCLVPSEAISTAVPVQMTSPTKGDTDQQDTPSSPASETDSTTSSYATGVSSLAGASFLECLFPLYPPNSGFLGKVAHSEKGSLSPQEQTSSDFNHESNGGATATIRRPPTLGELIMMSRRRSYQRKAIQMRKQNLSMEFKNKKNLGCCIFVPSIKATPGLRWKGHQPRLKLSWFN